MMTTKGVPPLRDVLYELSLVKPVPDASVLDEFTRRYPEYVSELTEFAIELALDAFQGEEQKAYKVAQLASLGVSKAMSRFHNRLYAVKHSAEREDTNSAQDAINPFSSLQRVELHSLAKRLNANSVFVMKLRDRMILLSTMSKGFLSLIAEELEISIEVLTTHFAAPPEMHPLTQFKADQKPEVSPKQTFEQAVQNSGLTPDQQEFLLNL